MQNPPGDGRPPQGQHGTQVMAQYPVAPPPPREPQAAPAPPAPTQPLPPPASWAGPAAAPPIQQPQVYQQPPPQYMQQQPVANGQWGPQGQMMQPRVVFGVPLEPNEKPLYFYQCSRMGGRIFQVILGIPFILMFGLGIYFIYLAITDRSHGTYAQVVTNRRIMAINGYGKPLWQIRWDDVRGLNKVTGKRYLFGVRNAAGEKFMFDDNVHIVEMVLTKFAGEPMLREQAQEVAYDHNVN